ncbi:phytoene synthase [Pelagivirga sediminicola]|uniref:Phytoene synthase n=1 Tax=Pelagivirga sediminicola TaxID=2170575 RepID=A0A2T7G897_9RHOB|nr:squalene/phytoene synthase family protein [Pelagivirga sediminicola]PVA10653.1 phytoene synthase [Pelagivirga sediminicola]
MPDLGQDLTGCAGLVERGDPARFRAAMAAPVAARRVLFPVYAFNVEVSRAPWMTQEPIIAEMRLQWWRDALDEIGAGGPVRRHEVVTPLADVLDAKGAGLLDALIAARQWDIYRDPFEDDAHLTSYLEKTSGNLMLAAARALGQADEAVVMDAGYAAGVANWLCAIPALEEAGRVPLLDGRPDAIRALAKGGLARLAAARKARSGVSAAARPALLAAWQAEGVLRRAAAHPGLVAQGVLAPSPIRSALGLAARSITGRW